jgi:hypothetical protein
VTHHAGLRPQRFHFEPYRGRMDSLDEAGAVHLTGEEFSRLIDAGILDGKIELLGGRVTFASYAAAFSAAQIRDAAELGVDLRPGAGQSR